MCLRISRQADPAKQHRSAVVVDRTLFQIYKCINDVFLKMLIRPNPAIRKEHLHTAFIEAVIIAAAASISTIKRMIVLHITAMTLVII